MVAAFLWFFEILIAARCYLRNSLALQFLER
jgi:hypothetical protein